MATSISLTRASPLEPAHTARERARGAQIRALAALGRPLRPLWATRREAVSGQRARRTDPASGPPRRE
eukprot:72971-Prymnesium_polylepis.1